MYSFLVAILTLLFSTFVCAQNVNLSHLHNETIEGIQVTFPVRGGLSFRFDNSITVDLDVTVDMSDFRKKLGAILAKGTNRNEECGDRVHLKHAHLNPGTNGTAMSNVRIEYEKWYCTYMDIPEIHGWSVKMVTRRTSKNRVAESGVIGDIQISPFIRNGTTINLNATVTRIHVVNDLARFLADTFDANLRQKAQQALNKGLGKNGAIAASLPQEIRPYVRLNSVGFNSSGGLSLRVTGTFEVRPDQIPSLCRQLIPRANCV